MGVVACAATLALVPPHAKAAGAPPVAPASGYAWPGDTLVFGPRESARCLECHGLPQFRVRDARTGAVHDRHVSAVAYTGSAHGGLDCTQCHDDVLGWPHAFAPARRRVQCDDACHAADSTGRAIRHDAARAALAASVHARGLEGRDPWQPGCPGCHGADAHAVPRTRGTTHAARAAACLSCHGEREAMREHAVWPDAVASYRESLHFKAMRRGSAGAPGCPDCHGAHDVRLASDPAARVHAAKLPGTCGQDGCHRGARLRFATSGANHVTARLDREPGLALIVGGLRGLGGLILLAMSVSVVLDLQRRAGERREPGSGAPVVRMSVPSRLQHAALAFAFVALALSGLPLRFAEAGALDRLTAALGGVAGARLLHRAGAMLLAAVLAIHGTQQLVALVRARFAAGSAWSMLPRGRDLADAWQSTRWQLRRSASPPALQRRHWREKLHYACVLGGACVMLATGLVLAWPVALAEWMPPAALAFALLVHGHEALLAIGILFVWHLYQVHVAPGPDHRWLTVVDGRVTEAHWRAEHALEAERVRGPEPGVPSRREASPRAGAVPWEAIALAAVLAGALVLRAREALRTPLWFDELFTLAVARLPGPELFDALQRDIHPPLFTWLVRGWMALGGEHALWLKTLPLLIGLATVAATYGFARRLAGPAVGLAAAAVLAAHHEHVYFSQELRGYGLLGLGVLLATWSAWCWREAPRRRAAIAWVLSASLAVYTHYLAFVVLAVLVALVALDLRGDPRRLRSWLGLQLGVAVLFAPQLPVLVGQLRLAQDHWLRHPAWGELLDFARHLAFGSRWAVPVVAGLVVAAFVPIRTRPAIRFTALALGICVLVPFVATWLGTHLYVQRYLYFVLPLLATLVAAGVMSPPWRTVRAVLLASLVLVGARAAWITPPHREAVALQAAARRVARDRQPDEPVFCVDAHTLLCLQRHLGPGGIRLVTDGRPLPFYLGEAIVPPSDRAGIDDVRAAAASGRRWWAVGTRTSGPTPALQPALLDSLAPGAHQFDLVRVWEGGS